MSVSPEAPAETIRARDAGQGSPPDPSASRAGCSPGCWGCGTLRAKPARMRWSNALYKRTSFPFRFSFSLLERLRCARVPKRLEMPGEDSYVSAHTRHHSRVRGWYGYHRVYDLVRNFHPTRNPSEMKLLSIGPRTEIELYYLWLFFGFSWKNLQGLDIVSTSPKIELGDISVKFPSPDSSFDVIVASHVLEKSRNPERTRDEIFRVARPGATIIIGGDRPVEGNLSPIPAIYFKNGAHGLIQLYRIPMENIFYLNSRSSHGYEIIFRAPK